MDLSFSPTHRGFTLIELMVALVVSGILAAIAYPAYTSHITRSRRADAVQALTAIVQAEERYRSNRGSYTDVIGAGGLDINASSIAQHYDVTVGNLSAGSGLASGYVVTAQAKSGSPQVSDSNCAKLIIRVDGALLSYQASDANDADTSSNCWPR